MAKLVLRGLKQPFFEIGVIRRGTGKVIYTDQIEKKRKK